MDITAELLARFAVAASCVSLLVAGVAVLAYEHGASRPEPIERDRSALAIVNYAGIGLFVIVGLIVSGANTGDLAEPPAPFGAAVRVIGMATLLIAGLLALWGLLSIGRNMASAAEVRPDTELVTSGAFGLVRHPLYLSILLLWAGGALALLSWVLALGFAILVPAFYARARTEEQLLAHHFGDAYTSYASRVPMLLPRVRRR